MIKLALYLVFISSSCLFLYNYFVYPLLIKLISDQKQDPHEGRIKSAEELDYFPKVSFIIAAYNEEKVIEQKLKNTLEIDYPSELFEVIVVSDGSSDSTSEIVENFGNGVIGMHDPKRGGKSAALNRAVEQAQGEVLVFSDANNDFSKDSVKQLIRHFEDEEIGAVTGAKHIYENNERESAEGDGLYWKYESQIKKAESKLGSITAAEGEILAVRTKCFNPIDSHKVNDDAAITFDLVKAGYRVLYEENAKSYEQASIDIKDDINVKVRMTFGGYQTIAHEKDFLFPPKTLFAFNFISHKVLRWLAPHFLILIFITSLMLWQNKFIFLLLLGQVAFYSLSLYGWKNRGKEKLPSYIYIPMYFTIMNYALFIGFLRYLNDSSKVQWKKAER
ncbi:glycosyltransferase family 2 protein [Aliikangiella sp. G2MR2-5]|uniref:glycosyltransferase family 2 protein n=1 Tax=Aliikangiella sp. G2MR2-5 TaxID=2788943 RepID=UPI0018AC2D1F|nr:glycosyltransferase family 2 protein [Aliikangiella sp. G2MR2-5]